MTYRTAIVLMTDLLVEIVCLKRLISNELELTRAVCMLICKTISKDGTSMFRHCLPAKRTHRPWTSRLKKVDLSSGVDGVVKWLTFMFGRCDL